MVTQHPALSVPSFRAQIDSDWTNLEVPATFQNCHVRATKTPRQTKKTLNQSQIQKYTKQGLYQLTVGNTDLILLGVFFL